MSASACDQRAFSSALAAPAPTFPWSLPTSAKAGAKQMRRLVAKQQKLR